MTILFFVFTLNEVITRQQMFWKKNIHLQVEGNSCILDLVCKRIAILKQCFLKTSNTENKPIFVRHETVKIEGK
jgi:hypothetical protein